LDLNLAETGARQHIADLFPGILLPRHCDEHLHVERGNRERAGAFMIEQHFMDDDASACRQALEALARQEPTLLRGPIMKNHSVEVQVRFREGILEEIRYARGDTAREPILLGKLTRDRADRLRIEDHRLKAG